MSNPFADPNRAEPLDGNPFDDTSDVNPFGTHANASSFSLEDQTTPNASKYSFGGNPAAESTTYSAREEELRRKDEEIRRREQELNMRERNLDRTEAKANWPPFFPLIRHQLSDLPDANQRTMKALYVQWLALIATLIREAVMEATGSAGLINTISMLSQGHIAAGVLGVISSVGWAFQTFAGGWLYKTVWDFKNNHEGLNFANATDQFKRESFKTVVMHQSRM
ncbi:hypothetical protein QFC21_000509 [Naganishia friedmannii]|uniref:Uncharacterized protein n=1 Tax=Naganishia friedmannii TaxID=89922 RepID=A0ACC2WBR9_9TREE|nr:hypothetical protein QFC21_000509 [Naganishia friedmannii]